MEHTIAAISTPFGRGGIAVIRLSGEEAIAIAAKVFFPGNGKALTEIDGGRTVYGKIVRSGRQIDDGIAAVFRAPKSFTGEDVVEISCHGGVLITEQVLSATFEAGAVQAGPGEFTRRAFTNGKLSLSQAEAIGLLIDAENEEQLKLASAHERGVFKQKADELYEKMKTLVTNVYANIDFPDEDLAELSDGEVLTQLFVLRDELSELTATYRTAHAVCEGIPTAIVGKPNTGKSSILNRLLGRERAIVTEVAGTTRDTIEESVEVGRVKLRLTDTAGIHETEDKVEKIGVERSLKALNEAELVLAVFDGSHPCEEEDRELLSLLQTKNAVKLALVNKSDLKKEFVLPGNADFTAVIGLSAQNGEGFEELTKKINDLFLAGEIDYDRQAVILNARQNASASRALENVKGAIASLESGLTSDMAGLDLEAALSELSELDGRRVNEEIVDGIFHHFCVGK